MKDLDGLKETLRIKLETIAEIESDFEHLFQVLFMVDKDAMIKKVDAINVLRTYRDKIKFHHEKIT